MKNDEVTDPKNGDSSNKVISESTRIRFAEKIARKEGVSRGAWIAGIIGLILVIAAVIVGITRFNTERKNQLAYIANQKQAYTEMLTKRDSMINESMATFDEIEKNLATIKEKEKIISMNSSDKEFSKGKKQQILDDIANINSLLEQNKKKIASLTAQLKNSGSTIKGLQVKIAELESSMKQREAEVTDLKNVLVQKDFQIGQLNTQVSDQQTAIAQKDEKIGKQTFELNKAYVASGTYKDLKAKGLVFKDGGFLGLGKKKLLQTNFADSSFTQVDISQTKTIPVNSKDAQLITEHPAGSYEMIHDKNNYITSIEIKDPEQFWKISKYAVVEVKK